MTTPAERRARRRQVALNRAFAMAGAYERITGTPLNAGDRDTMYRAGWTVATLGVVQRLTAFAWDNRSGIYTKVRVSEDSWREKQDRAEIARLLAWTGRAWSTTFTQAPIATVVPWLAMLAGAPDPDEQERVHRLALNAEAPTMPTFGARWVAAAPGREGALAYAAGLTAAETAERAAAGLLNVDDLLVLAGLRGWCFAPDLLEPDEPGDVLLEDGEVSA